jgi:hypothetical protein
MVLQNYFSSWDYLFPDMFVCVSYWLLLRAQQIVGILSIALFLKRFLMDRQHQRNFKDWSILCHNIRGINSDEKWNAVRNKALETGCDIICLQETKRELFDAAYLKKCPRGFDSFSYIPSIGASGGTIIAWKSAKLEGQVVFENSYAS